MDGIFPIGERAKLSSSCVGAPYAAGANLTLADFYTFFTFALASGVAQQIYGEDLLDGHPKIQSVMGLMAEHPSVAAVEADKAA